MIEIDEGFNFEEFQINNFPLCKYIYLWYKLCMSISIFLHVRELKK